MTCDSGYRVLGLPRDKHLSRFVEMTDERNFFKKMHVSNNHLCNNTKTMIHLAFGEQLLISRL